MRFPPGVDVSTVGRMKLQPTRPAKALGYTGPAGDHNVHAVRAVPALLREVARATGRGEQLFGSTFSVVQQSSVDHLAVARDELTAYADAVSEQLVAGHPIVCVNARCATGLATIPRVLISHPEAVVVWLDAHADLNVPGGSDTDYLGGMAVSGPLGWWDSGLGAGLSPEQLILVGTRSIDAPEAASIDDHHIALLAREVTTGAALTALTAGRPIYFHLDCDVLEPGIFRTDYQEPDGLSLAQLQDIASALSMDSEIVGVEIAEWEGPGTHQAADLVRALAPLLARLAP